MNKRGFLGIPFAWLFAMIVGAFILFLAIYAATKLINTDVTTSDAKIAKEIGVLLNPLETSFETSKTTFMELPSETRIYNKCSDKGIFGKQIIKVSQKTFNKWSETDIDIGFPNKYIFSKEYVEGKKFYVFSKPFKFPFKVADLIYITSSEDIYCFVNAPENIKEEIEDIKQKNLFVTNCPQDSKNICFGSGSNCDVAVNIGAKNVKKDQDTLHFEGDALMYAAIFSDKEVYECHLKRLIKRTAELAFLYDKKANNVRNFGCDTNLDLIKIGRAHV